MSNVNVFITREIRTKKKTVKSRLTYADLRMSRENKTHYERQTNNARANKIGPYAEYNTDV